MTNDTIMKRQIRPTAPLSKGQVSDCAFDLLIFPVEALFFAKYYLPRMKTSLGQLSLKYIGPKIGLTFRKN